LPLGIALACGAIAFVAWRWRRFARVLVGVTILVPWVASAPAFAKWLTARLEMQYPLTALAEVPRADVAIVLGGVLGPPVPPRTEPDLADPIDRVVDAWRLYRLGKVAAIVVSGGNLPWATATEPEAVLIKRLLVELGVPDEAVFVETKSANTHENAVSTAPVIKRQGWQSVLLVTSAVHMPRAMAAFRKEGIDSIPVPTDIHAGGPLYESPLDLLPDADALAETTGAFRELLGLVYYRLRGWA
jgi:uncharacterized SAM-binding protein YcdF (DUF218 family)